MIVVINLFDIRVRIGLLCWVSNVLKKMIVISIGLIVRIVFFNLGIGNVKGFRMIIVVVIKMIGVVE